MSAEKTMEIVLEQWKTCVEMANSISQRRDTMNNIFVSVNLALIAAIALKLEMKSIFLLVAGIVLCVLWILFIRNYKHLNKAKFDVIMNLEQKLPEKPFVDEWRALTTSSDYKEGTKLEQILPWMFIILYLIAILVIIIPALGNLCTCGC